MLDASEADFPFFGVEHLDGLGVGGKLIVRQACAAHAQVVVAFPLYLFEVVFSGYAGIEADEHLLSRIVRHARLCGERVHHVGQGIGVGCVAGQYRGIADEALGVDAQCQNEQLAVRALLFGTPVHGLPTAILAPLEVEVGQVEQDDAVGDVEQIIGAAA